MFLTPTELAELTGRKQPGRQAKQLREMGVPFYLNACGHPKVVRAVLEGSNKPAPQPKTWTPSWAATLP